MPINFTEKSDVNLSFRLRDLFLDFLACLVPGFVFVVTITLFVLGIIFLSSYSIWMWSSSGIDKLYAFLITTNFFSYYTFHFWFTAAIVFISFIVGHILYRLNPKTPDYASFLRMRKKVITKKKENREKDEWVVKRGFGVVSKEVQFPYDNLKRYLEARGFEYLSKYILYDNEITQRSKTFINKLKIRIFLAFPGKTHSIIRNEAHIRLASSVWYAARYIIKTSYLCGFILVMILLFTYFSFFFKKTNALDLNVRPNFVIYFIENFDCIFLSGCLLSVIVASVGFLNRQIAKFHMRLWNKEKIEKQIDKEEDEKKARIFCSRILFFHNVYDFAPLFMYLFLLVNSMLLLICGNSEDLRLFIKYTACYGILSIFLLIGAIFSKHRIEETIHYQRVREIVYVLETAFICGLISDTNENDITTQ